MREAHRQDTHPRHAKDGFHVLVTRLELADGQEFGDGMEGGNRVRLKTRKLGPRFVDESFKDEARHYTDFRVRSTSTTGRLRSLIGTSKRLCTGPATRMIGRVSCGAFRRNVVVRNERHVRRSIADWPRSAAPQRALHWLALAVLAFAIYLPTPALAAGDPPALHPGLWEARTSFPSRPQARAQVTRICIDAQTQTHMLQQTSLAMLHMCSRHEYGMHAGHFVTSSYCTIAGSIIEGRTETTFYRDTAYHTEVVGRIMPAGRTVASQRTVIDARHVGKCPADMRAGDMTLPNGQRLNLVDMSAVLAR